jgi:hypothetical protein
VLAKSLKPFDGEDRPTSLSPISIYTNISEIKKLSESISKEFHMKIII